MFYDIFNINIVKINMLFNTKEKYIFVVNINISKDFVSFV